jgi:hypothetical protein
MEVVGLVRLCDCCRPYASARELLLQLLLLLQHQYIVWLLGALVMVQPLPVGMP